MDILQNQSPRAGRATVFGEGKRGWQGWSPSKASFDKVCGVKAWRLHDLRRTAATGMANEGVQPHIVEAVINHASGHKAGVAGIYNRASYSKEKREALDLWAHHLNTEIAKASGANITSLKKAKA
jgi:integrase